MEGKLTSDITKLVIIKHRFASLVTNHSCQIVFIFSVGRCCGGLSA